MIVVCEPQCKGFEHVEVNTAVLQQLSQTFNNDNIILFAEKYHSDEVKSRLDNKHIVNISYEIIDIPPKNYPNFVRFPYEFLLINKIFSKGCDKVIFLSITSATLLSIRLWMLRYTNIKCVVIPHAILESILEKPSLFPLETPFWFKFVLSFTFSKKIYYLVLGPSIEKILCEILPKIKTNVGSINHPYQFNSNEIGYTSNTTISFGSIGVGTQKKGILNFYNLINEISELNTVYSPKFTLIGYIPKQKIFSKKPNNLILPSNNRPLSRIDFNTHIKIIDYSIYYYSKNSYQLTASGALFDAISYLKPIIAIRNPFFEYYFDLMGDIGYLCENDDELKNIIIDILNNGNFDRYIIQQKNLLNGREKLYDANMLDNIKLFFNK